MKKIHPHFISKLFIITLHFLFVFQYGEKICQADERLAPEIKHFVLPYLAKNSSSQETCHLAASTLALFQDEKKLSYSDLNRIFLLKNIDNKQFNNGEKFALQLRNISNFYNNVRTHSGFSVPEESLQDAFLHEHSQQQLTAIVEKSQERLYSEVGGLLILHQTHDNPSLEFVPIKGIDEEFTRELRQADGNFSLQWKLLRDNPQRFYFLEFDYHACLRQLNRKISMEAKEARLKMFLDLYFFTSKYTYEPSFEDFIEVVGIGLKGRYLGLFHVHPEENLPSLEDKAASLLQPQYVVVPRENGVSLYRCRWGGCQEVGKSGP